jgi:hypothetical protein
MNFDDTRRKPRSAPDKAWIAANAPSSTRKNCVSLGRTQLKTLHPRHGA